MSAELSQVAAPGAPALSWKPYPAYKDSGVEWLGKVPEHWDLRRVSRSFSLIGSGATPESGNKKYYETGVIHWIITGDLNDGILESCEKKITYEAFEKYTALKIYPKGTILIAMYGATIGKVSLLNFEACTNQACCALGGSSFFIDKFTFYWFLANKRNIVNLSYGGGQPNISQEIIKSLKLTCPPVEEQRSIARYLDDRTRKMDSLIEKKQKLIELLKEERAAVINQAVTKGLDPGAPMRDSGVEWLGEIPKNWEVKKLKWVCSINPIKSNSFFSRNSEELVTFLPMEKVSEDGKIDTELKRPLKDLWNGFTYFEDDDIIVAKITPCFENGKSALITNLGSKIGFGSTEFHVIRPKKNIILNELLYYLTKTDIFMMLGEASMTGAAGQKRVPSSFIENL